MDTTANSAQQKGIFPDSWTLYDDLTCRRPCELWTPDKSAMWVTYNDNTSPCNARAREIDAARRKVALRFGEE